jgi:hypothetical protein
MKKLILILTIALGSIAIANAQVDSLKLYDIYNFDIGDEFHYDFYNPWSSYQDIFKVVDKEISVTSDTITYTFFRIYKNRITNETGSHQTIVKHTNLNSYLSIKPPIDTCFMRYDTVHNYFDSTYYVSEAEQCHLEKDSIKESQFNQRLAFISVRDGIKISYQDSYYFSHWNKSVYVLGVGKVKDYKSSFWNINSWGSSDNLLLYYKKGTEEWGTPLILSTKDIEKEALIKNLTLYPNPATNQLTISYASIPQHDNKIEIYNAVGVLLKYIPLPPSKGDSNAEIDISELPKGLYFVKIGNEISKFVKE